MQDTIISGLDRASNGVGPGNMLKSDGNSRRFRFLRCATPYWHVALLALAVGCQDREPRSSGDSNRNPRPQVALSVLVVGNPELAEGISLLRGEWTERTGGSFDVQAIAVHRLAPSDSLDADLVIYPPRLLGELVERDWLRPMRASVVEHPDMAMADILPLVREGEIVYGSQVYAAPLGCQTLLMCWNAELLEQRDLDRPETWRQLAESSALANSVEVPSTAVGRQIQQVADREHDRKAKMERMHLAYMVLARAAAFTEPNLRTTFCFAADDMTPRLTEAPFARAMENLLRSEHADVAATASMTTNGPNGKPQSAVDRVLAGEAPAAVGWPPTASNAQGSTSSASASGANVAWSELPAAEEQFDAASQQWRPADVKHAVPLLGPGGQLVSVSKASRNAVSAFQLCQWLASGSVTRQLAGSGGGPFPCRRSLLPDIGDWLDPALPPGQTADIGRAVEAAMSHREFAQFPRIPGVDDYLAALGDAVASCLQGDSSAVAALQSAAERWDKITESRGREAQLRAFRRHLGIEPSDRPGQPTTPK